MATLTYTLVKKRPRGSKKIRVGFHPGITTAMRGELTKEQVQGRQKTPIQKAREELSRALDNYNISEELKWEIISEAVRLDTFATMNMPTLAAVMIYLHDFPEPAPDDFTDEILNPYINHLMQDFITPSKSAQAPTLREQAEVRYRYKQTILRYILKVLALRMEAQPGEQLSPLETEIPTGPRGEDQSQS